MNPSFFTVIKKENDAEQKRQGDKDKQNKAAVVKTAPVTPRKTSDQNLGSNRGSHADLDD